MNLQAIANPSGVSLEDKVNDTGGAVSRSHEIVNVSPTKIVGKLGLMKPEAAQNVMKAEKIKRCFILPEKILKLKLKLQIPMSYNFNAISSE